MNRPKSALFLWIILGAILVLLIPVAIIDRVAHSPLTLPANSTAGATPREQPKIGWRIGDEAPDFLLTTTDNHDIKLSDYRGRPVMVNFWATWCGPCRLEAVALKAVSPKLSRLGVVLLAVSVKDSMENAQSYARDNDLDWVIPVDPTGTVAGYYNVRGIPTTYFIDEKGIVTSIKIGPFLNEEEVLERLPGTK